MLYKLGKLPPKRDLRTFLFAKYLANLPNIPTTYSWLDKVDTWGMMKNDTIGDCTCAAAGHLIMEWTANCNVPFIPTDTDIVVAYQAITGYDPISGANDTGASEIDVLNYWRTTGIGGHRIGAYAAVNVNRKDLIKAAIYLFGGVYLGINLPKAVQGKDTWETPHNLNGDNEAGSWGGHAVPAVAYDKDYLTVITWGKPLKVRWGFFGDYTEEAYAIISPDFVYGTTPAPNGFDIAALQKDLNNL